MVRAAPLISGRVVRLVSYDSVTLLDSWTFWALAIRRGDFGLDDNCVKEYREETRLCKRQGAQHGRNPSGDTAVVQPLLHGCNPRLGHIAGGSSRESPGPRYKTCETRGDSILLCDAAGYACGDRCRSCSTW